MSFASRASPGSISLPGSSLKVEMFALTNLAQIGLRPSPVRGKKTIRAVVRHGDGYDLQLAERRLIEG